MSEVRRRTSEIRSRSLEVRNQTSDFRNPIKSLALSVLGKLGAREAYLEVVLVSDATMRALNRLRRGKDRPTNVLSIEYPKDEISLGGYRLLGEVYLAPSYISRAGDDIARLLIHGILHLCGYSHETERDRIAMDRRENELYISALRSFRAQPLRFAHDAQHRTGTRRRIARHQSARR
ncbi:MAG: rRNA maturation RNase YbeY [Candidatus Colwellbacteria bacterium]|nr:rRNA maturation RNase YbeY [Candidatus Colwellbacteria bacterium]